MDNLSRGHRRPQCQQLWAILGWLSLWHHGGALWIAGMGLMSILVYRAVRLHDWFICPAERSWPSHDCFLINIRHLLLCLHASTLFVSPQLDAEYCRGSFWRMNLGLDGLGHIQKKLLLGWWAIISWVTLPGLVLFGAASLRSPFCPILRAFGLDFASRYVYWHFSSQFTPSCNVPR